MVKWRNATGRKGMERLVVDGMTLIRRKDTTTFWLHAPRGKGPLADDWGPFEIEVDDPFRKAREWNEILRAKGWFSADLAEWDSARIAKAVGRLPRSPFIPGHLLREADNRRISDGKGLGKNTLLVGGIDVHRTDSTASGESHQPRREKANITFAKPGSHPRSMANLEMRVDGPALEALIMFLTSVRMDLVSKETEKALDEATFADDGPLPGDMAGRLRSWFKVRDDIDRLTATIMGMSSEKRDLVYLLVQQVADGNPAIGFALPEGPQEDDVLH